MASEIISNSEAKFEEMTESRQSIVANHPDIKMTTLALIINGIATQRQLRKNSASAAIIKAKLAKPNT